MRNISEGTRIVAGATAGVLFLVGLTGCGNDKEPKPEPTMASYTLNLGHFTLHRCVYETFRLIPTPTDLNQDYVIKEGKSPEMPYEDAPQFVANNSVAFASYACSKLVYSDGFDKPGTDLNVMCETVSSQPDVDKASSPTVCRVNAKEGSLNAWLDNYLP